MFAWFAVNHWISSSCRSQQILFENTYFFVDSKVDKSSRAPYENRERSRTFRPSPEFTLPASSFLPGSDSGFWIRPKTPNSIGIIAFLRIGTSLRRRLSRLFCVPECFSHLFSGIVRRTDQRHQYFFAPVLQGMFHSLFRLDQSWEGACYILILKNILGAPFRSPEQQPQPGETASDWDWFDRSTMHVCLACSHKLV